MDRYIFKFEIALAINILLQLYGVIDDKFAHYNFTSYRFDALMSFSFFNLFLIKYFVEGHRLNSLLLIAFESITISNTYFLDSDLFKILSTVIGLLYCYSIYYFPVFKLPKASGPFESGYKIFKIDSLEVAVYYPSKVLTTNTYWDNSKTYWKNLYAALHQEKSFHMNRTIFKFFTSYLEHIKINVQFNTLLNEKKDPHNVLILSHNLGSTMNSYTGFGVELASHGFIVFCPNHQDEITWTRISVEELRKQRFEQLRSRQNDIKKLVDFIYNKKKIDKLFFQNEVSLLYENLSVTGNGFGGATAIYAAFEESRIKSALCVDPWAWVFPDTYLSKSIKKPLLSVTSDNHWKKYPEYDNIERLGQLFAANKDFKGSSVNFSLKNCSFIPQDLSCFMPRECLRWGFIDIIDTIHEQYIYMTRLLYNFYYSSNVPDGKISLLEKFEEEVGKSFMHENLVLKN